MTSKEKIIAYLSYKEISQRKFSLRTGLSEGILRAGKNLGVDKIKIIKEQFPDLNMDWVIYDEGEMLLTGINNHLEDELEKFILDCIDKYFLDKETTTLKI